MGHWMVADIDNLEGVFPKKYKQPSCLILDIANKPMDRDAFEYVVVMFLRHIGFGGDYFITIGYETPREDNVSCIQAYKQLDETYHVEIVLMKDDDIPYYIYTKEDLDLTDALRYFRKVLIDMERPDLSLWIDDTDYSGSNE